MARSKAKHDADVPSMLARLRPRWFDGLSPQDLSHVLSLIDMGMDPARTSGEEAVSCESFAANLIPCGSGRIREYLLIKGSKAIYHRQTPGSLAHTLPRALTTRAT
jgi:hypothetical protein